MRLWSLHPKHLDRAGLIASWREALLAQKVLAGKTKGYRNHSQLIRFLEADDPMVAIGSFLTGLHIEATSRGYSFDLSRVTEPNGRCALITATEGQMLYERARLLSKVSLRSREDVVRISRSALTAHPTVLVVPGDKPNDWERVDGPV